MGNPNEDVNTTVASDTVATDTAAVENAATATDETTTTEAATPVTEPPVVTPEPVIPIEPEPVSPVAAEGPIKTATEALKDAAKAADTDNLDSRGEPKGDAEISGSNLGPRGEGAPPDAFVPDTRSPIEQHVKGKKDTTTDSIDSRGEDQGDQPTIGPRGTGVKSSPETFRH